MTDCEGKDIQVGDTILTFCSVYREGSKMVKGTIIKITKKTCNVDYTYMYCGDIHNSYRRCTSEQIYKI